MAGLSEIRLDLSSLTVDSVILGVFSVNFSHVGESLTIPAGNYQLTKRTRYLHDEETDTDTPYNYSFEIYCECTSMDDYNDYVNEFKAIADANEKLEYDAETDGYVYKNAEGTPMWEVYGQNFEQVTGQKFTDLWGRSYNQTFVLVIENLNVPDEIKNMWNE